MANSGPTFLGVEKIAIMGLLGIGAVFVTFIVWGTRTSLRQNAPLHHVRDILIATGFILVVMLIDSISISKIMTIGANIIISLYSVNAGLLLFWVSLCYLIPVWFNAARQSPQRNCLVLLSIFLVIMLPILLRLSEDSGWTHV